MNLLRFGGALALLLSVASHPSHAQPAHGQTIRGIVVDAVSQVPLPGASVVVPGSDPFIGAVTDAYGTFALQNVPLGRQTIQVTFLGYEPAVRTEVPVTSGREVVLRIQLQEHVVTGEEVTVAAETDRAQPLNEMAVVSARSFSVEETRRYAGGVDDPARMASAFAGVTSAGGVQENALVIRGNTPRGVQWRLEGIEIPNPNHFAGLTVAGGGGLTLFSAQVLSNSDFFTGAFPAEYGNALSGVFDMNFRSGNAAHREHAIQLGVLGVEAASEGPFVRGKPSTYLFNYRYSTLGLLMPLLPTEGGTTYQDLSFKLSFPTRKAGRFDVWGIGGLDRQTMEENPDSSIWESEFWDRTRSDLKLGVGAFGISHGLVIGSNTYLHTTLGATINRTRWDQQRLDDQIVLQPNLFIHDTSGRLVLSTAVDHKFSARHANRTGASVQQLMYDLSVRSAPDDIPPVVPVAGGRGTNTLAQAYTESRLSLTPRFTLSAGVHALYFALNGETALEPRAGLRWQATGRQVLSLGYGLHSQIEDLRFYLVERPAGQGTEAPNRDLGFTRAHHLVAGYERALGEATHLKLEGYYQYLFDVPVIRDSSYSLLNLEQDWTFDEALVNDGKGRNYGLDLTLERAFKNGYYYLLTGSLYRSRYRGGGGIWRNTRFDQNFATNALFGREITSRNGHHVLGLNGRLILLGGQRRSPLDLAASLDREEVVFDAYRAFEDKMPALILADVTVTYRINRRRHSEVWALQIKNALAAKDTYLDYNFSTRSVEQVKEGYPLPVLSYKIEF